MTDPATRFDALTPILTQTDSLSIGDGGALLIEGWSARDLVEHYGSPLYVISERTLRLNLRRVTRGLAERWTRPSRVLYAIKANNSPAVRAIAHSEGAGGDCFGLAEIHATFAGGADAGSIVLNGSSKSDAELERAVELGITVNLDAEDEPARLATLAERAGRRIRVNVRLKVASDALDAFRSDYDDGASSMTDQVLPGQWGLSPELAARVVEDVLARPALDLLGYHVHIGRVTNEPAFYRAWARVTADTVADLHGQTGAAPRILDMGGGFARERDPESRSLALNPHRIEAHLDALTGGLREGFEEAALPLPDLWVEPGRYIAGNAGVLLGTVGGVKRDLGRTWVHVDFSVNNLMRIELYGVQHHVLAAENLHEPPAGPVDIVGPLCAGGPIAADRPFPVVARGDVVAVLDAGMYAEIFTTRYNGVPLPATVLVNGDQADVIRDRETVADVFSKHRLPERLRH